MTDPTNWIAGGESGIVYQDMKVDFTEFLPEGENQALNGFDDQSCVTHAKSNLDKVQLNFYKTQDAGISAALAKFNFLDAAGKVNFDDQYVAIGSGTTPQGNDGTSVAEFVRKNGYVPAGTINKRGNNVTQYLTKNLVTAPMLALGAQFWAEIDMTPLYEWIPCDGPDLADLLAYHVKQAPLQLFINLCPGYNSSNPVKTCPIAPPQHSIMLYSVAQVYQVFDSELPNMKGLNKDYPIVACLKSVLTKTPPAATKPVYAFHSDLQQGSTGADVVSLQNMLIYEGFLNVHLNTGYFGINTFNALCKWQMAHSTQVLVPAHLATPTGYFGAYSRAYANAIYSA